MDKEWNTDISAEDLFEIFIAFIILIVAIIMVIKRPFWKTSKNICFHIFSLGRTFDSSGFSSQVAR